MTDVSEHRLQTMVIDLLSKAARKDVFAFAIPNAARRSFSLGRRMKAEGLVSGVADLCVMLPSGRVGWLEMKAAKGRQSIEQKGFEARCQRLGHHYAIAKSFEEATAFLGKIGALK